MSNDATHINICKLMGITYIVYCSEHFSRKAAKIALSLTTGIVLGPKKACIIRIKLNYYIYIRICLCTCDCTPAPVKGENSTSFGHQLGQLSLM